MLFRSGHEAWATDLRAPEGAASAPSDGQIILGRLDVRRRADISAWFRRVAPELVVHLAAETDVDLCQARPSHAHKTNARGTRLVAQACQEANTPLAYVSTAGVFDGEKDDAYVEEDAPNPIAVYGLSKLEGEHHVRALARRHYIVRSGWMVGGGDKDHKFVAKILHQIREGATTIYAVGDRLGTPTYALDFARCFTRLIATEGYGLYHMAGRGRGTRYEVARVILEVLGLARSVKLVEVDSAFFRESFPAPRPRSEWLRNLMLQRRGLDTMRPWEEALEDYLLTSFGDLREGRRGAPPSS